MLATVLLLLATGALYLGWRVWQAGRATPALLADIERVQRLTLSDLSADRIAMLLAVEDPSFWTHDGIDQRTPGQGRTTLSQSLGKLIYFDDFDPGPWDKLQLMLMTRYGLERRADKRRILGAFLNRAYFGGQGSTAVIGLESAARNYFGVSAEALTSDQFLSLVAMLIAPSTLAPDRYPAANAERVRRIRLILAGRCRPTGVTDVWYERCAAAV